MSSIEVILAGPDEKSLMRSAYPALMAAGLEVAAVADTPEKLCDLVAAASPDLVVVEANIAPSPQKALELFSGLDVELAVVLPPAWVTQRGRFADEIERLVAGFASPVTWPRAAQQLAERMAENEEREDRGDEETRGQGAGETRG